MKTTYLAKSFEPRLRFINFKLDILFIFITFFSPGTNVIKSLPEFTASKLTLQLEWAS